LKEIKSLKFEINLKDSEIVSLEARINELEAKLEQTAQKALLKDNDTTQLLNNSSFEIRLKELKNELEKVTHNLSFKDKLIFCLRSRVSNLENKLEQILLKSYQSTNDSKTGSDAIEEVSSFSKTPSLSSHYLELEPDEIPIIIRENVSYLVIFNGSSSAHDISKIVERYTDDIKQGSIRTYLENHRPKIEHISYRRPKVYKSQIAIYFKCWRLVKITEVKPKKEHWEGWRRYGYKIKSKDLMQYHWNNEYFNTKIQNKSSLLSSPLLPPKPVILIGGLSRYIYKHNASAPKIKNLWNNQSNMSNISSRTSLNNFADVYFNSV
ncbi:11973_t:CDS:2, partial [Dentiscutata heterogama]